MGWSKDDQIAYLKAIEADLSGPTPEHHPPRRAPLCSVRMGQACEFTVGPSQRCWYCLLTRAQIAEGLTLGEVLGVSLIVHARTPAA